MTIHEFYYLNKRLFVEFSTEEDGDDFYRNIELEYSDILESYPGLLYEEDLREMDENFVIEILIEYFRENDLPDPEKL